MARRYGSRFDDEEIQVAAVSDHVTYDQIAHLYTLVIANGTLSCEQLRSTRTARRITRLTATYPDGDEMVTAVCNVASDQEEQEAIQRFERRMHAAARRTTVHDGLTG